MLNQLFDLSSILEETITMQSFLICTAVSLALGILTALVYLLRSRCSQSFAVTLAILPTIVEVVIMLVNGSIGAGVAVAGAFSLVRFRSAPGTAKEIGAIFLAMALGLATGMGYITLAILLFVIVAACMLALNAVKFGGREDALRTLRITIPENLDYDGLFDDLFAAYTRKAELEKVKTSNMGTLFELQYTVLFKSPEAPKEFIDALRVRNGNLNISCSKYAAKDAL